MFLPFIFYSSEKQVKKRKFELSVPPESSPPPSTLLFGNMASAKALTTSLEQARRQQQSNDTLRSAVLDTDELAQRVLMQTTALKRRSDLTKWTKQLSDQLSEFEKQCSFINIRRFNPAKMLAECDQHVGMGELVHCETSGKADGLPQTDNVAEFTELLNGFKTIKQNADRTAKAPLSQFAEEAKQAAEKKPNSCEGDHASVLHLAQAP